MTDTPNSEPDSDEETVIESIPRLMPAATSAFQGTVRWADDIGFNLIESIKLEVNDHVVKAWDNLGAGKWLETTGRLEDNFHLSIADRVYWRRQHADGKIAYHGDDLDYLWPDYILMWTKLCSDHPHTPDEIKQIEADAKHNEEQHK